MLVCAGVISGGALWLFDRDVLSFGSTPNAGLEITGTSVNDFTDIGERFIIQLYDDVVNRGDQWSVPADPGITFLDGSTLAFPQAGTVL